MKDTYNETNIISILITLFIYLLLGMTEGLDFRKVNGIILCSTFRLIMEKLIRELCMLDRYVLLEYQYPLNMGQIVHDFSYSMSFI